jgi:hypothetical protein
MFSRLVEAAPFAAVRTESSRRGRVRPATPPGSEKGTGNNFQTDQNISIRPAESSEQVNGAKVRSVGGNPNGDFVALLACRRVAGCDCLRRICPSTPAPSGWEFESESA